MTTLPKVMKSKTHLYLMFRCVILALKGLLVYFQFATQHQYWDTLINTASVVVIVIK